VERGSRREIFKFFAVYVDDTGAISLTQLSRSRQSINTTHMQRALVSAVPPVKFQILHSINFREAVQPTVT